MRRTVYPEVPVHVEYALTEAGRTLSEPLRAGGMGDRAPRRRVSIAGSLRPRGLTSSRRKTMIAGQLTLRRAGSPRSFTDRRRSHRVISLETIAVRVTA